jgi:hypothetical protein
MRGLRSGSSSTRRWRSGVRSGAGGVAEFQRSKETFRDKELGIMIKSTLKGRHAAAEATGTVRGLGQNFTPEPSESAELQTQNDGTIVIGKMR